MASFLLFTSLIQLIRCEGLFPMHNRFFFLFFLLSVFSFAGYITRGCSQPKEVDLTLKLLVSAAPIALIFVGLGILYTYPITEERRQGNRKILQELR